MGRLRGTELVAYDGFVDRPGQIGVWPRGGLLAALVATVAMVAAAARRSSESERLRKRPATIQETNT